MHRVVIIGGGFAGLYAAKSLASAPVDVTVIDRRNFHLFQPLLYQVATAGLSPGDIACPLRWALRSQKNTRVLVGEVTGIDCGARRVLLQGGEAGYDTLLLATGATHSYFGHPEWASRAPGLKTIEDATSIRARLFLAFEAAEREQDPARRTAWLTFVIVGAGPTGVELAGTLGEIARDTLQGDFRQIDPAETRIILLDAAPRVLSAFPADLSAKAERHLIDLRVRPRPGMKVVAIDEKGVSAVGANGEEERIEAHTVLWAAGVQASPLGRLLADATGARVDGAGRVFVESDLTVPGHPEIFVLGDLAHVENDGKLVPGLCPAAIQMGQYAARVLRNRVAGKGTPPFRYWNKGTLATIGRHAAVADFGWLRFGGRLAWLAWLLIHLFFLIGYQNRIVVMLRWAFAYLTFNRGARLITGDLPPLPPFSLNVRKEPQ
jgi:NADH:ubiquinone reductase (H+-translocating)